MPAAAAEDLLRSLADALAARWGALRPWLEVPEVPSQPVGCADWSVVTNDSEVLGRAAHPENRPA